MTLSISSCEVTNTFAKLNDLKTSSSSLLRALEIEFRGRISHLLLQLHLQRKTQYKAHTPKHA